MGVVDQGPRAQGEVRLPQDAIHLNLGDAQDLVEGVENGGSLIVKLAQVGFTLMKL